MNNKQFYSIAAIYVFVNGIFVYKYGMRQEVIFPLLLLILYLLFSIGILFLSKKLSIKHSESKLLSRLYWAVVIACSIVFTLVILKIDGYSLKVDRWSALQLTVEGLLKGNYPYTRMDHLGQMSSNFPALGFLGLPFYLLGDVGYLQVFTFILFALFLYKRSNNILTAFCLLGLFVLSPAMLWEIFAKSDLASNIMLVVLFVEWWTVRYRRNVFQKPFVLGAIVSFFLLTRGIVLIPLIIFFLKDFLDSSFNTKVKFSTSVLLTGLLICLPTILSAPGWDILLNYNPLTLQVNKAPSLSYLFLLLPFVIPFVIEKYKGYQFYVALVILSIPFTGFLYAIIKVGWHQTIFEHKYDVSYLSMCLPPLLIWIKKNVEVKS